MSIPSFLKKKLFLTIILAGILIRLLMLFFFNHVGDFFSILTLTKSVADTGNLTDGFSILKTHGMDMQLYGKIYYQIGAIWLFFLDKVKILELRYLFDTHPFTNSETYMMDFGQWVPTLYQIIAIKLIQSIYDIMLLVSMLKIAKRLNIKNTTGILLFWALNPFLIFVNYIMFQSDIAMIAALMGGVYFGIKALQDQDKKLFSKSKLISLALFALGAVIKQAPLLFVPVFLIFFSSSFVTFLFYTVAFVLFYILIGQPWATDMHLMKQFFMNSVESLAIFKFQINGVSVFLFLYITFIASILLLKDQLLRNIKNILYLVAILFIILYLGEDSTFLFPQFTIWIFPVLALIAADKPVYAWFFIIPIIGYIKRSLVDNDFFAGSLSTIFGPALADVPSYQVILKSFFSPILADIGLTTLFTFSLLILLFYLVQELFQKNSLEELKKKFSCTSWIDLSKASILIFAIYFIFLFVDYTVKSTYVIVKQGSHQRLEQEMLLSNSPIQIELNNPSHLPLTALEIKAKRNRITYNKSVLLQIFDKNNHNLLLTQEIPDYQFPPTAAYVPVQFNRPINDQHVILELSQTGNDEISVYKTKKTSNKSDTLYATLFALHEPTHNNHTIQRIEKNSGIDMKMRVAYPLSSGLNTLTDHISSKPKFFMIYFGLIIGIIIALSVLLFSLKTEKKRRFLFWRY